MATVSTAAPLRPSERSGSALSWEPLRLDTRVGFGTIYDPFSAHRYLDFQGELSHVTLARGEEADDTLSRLFVACVEHGFVGDVFWNHSGGKVAEGVSGVQGALLDGKGVERNELVAWIVVGHNADKSVRVSANFRVSVNPGTTFAVSSAASKFEASKALGLAVALLSAQGGGRAGAWSTGKNKFLETESDATLPEGARAVREGGYAFRLVDAAMNPAP